MGRRRDRDMTPDEEFEFSETLFRGATKLGFPLVRIQSAKPELLRRLLPVAEELELKLAYEIHAPMGPNAPEIMKVRDAYAELDSPLLGFVADFSVDDAQHVADAAARGAACGTRRRRRADAAGRSGRRMPRCRSASRSSSATCKSRDFDPGRLGSFAHLAFNMHGHVDPREWADIMPQILHVHAKFYDIDENGQEPAIDYPELVRVFVEGGYRGYWSSEWEGHAFAELGEVDPLAARAQAARPHPPQHAGAAAGMSDETERRRHMAHVTATTDVTARLERTGDVTQLVVHGRSTLLIGGQVHNSTSSHPDSIARAFARAADIGSNTVFAPVDWAGARAGRGSIRLHPRRYDARRGASTRSAVGPAVVRCVQERPLHLCADAGYVRTRSGSPEPW